MKYSSLIFTIVILLHIGCTKNGSLKSYTFNATIASQLTNQTIPGAKVYVSVHSKHYSGSYIYETLIDSFNVTSDNNGNINCKIKYNDNPYISVKFDKIDDAHSTGFLSQKTEFALSDLKSSPQLILFVRKYAQLIINLKNNHPFDDNDAVEVSFSQNNTNYINDLFSSIQNFGIMNQPWSYPAADDGNNPYWVGKNVNAVLFGKIQEGTTYQITWNVRKNGINMDYNSPIFATSMNSINSYDILY